MIPPPSLARQIYILNLKTINDVIERPASKITISFLFVVGRTGALTICVLPKTDLMMRDVFSVAKIVVAWLWLGASDLEQPLGQPFSSFFFRNQD